MTAYTGVLTVSLDQVLPLSVFDPVETALTLNDRASLLALQGALRGRLREYAYLEIGSHLGGSLQPFLADDRCIRVYSIDPRPASQPDERGVADRYPANSTERMLATLRPAYRPRMHKLVSFERDARDVAADEVPDRPSFCFIDGEHTDIAAYRDFESCRRLAAARCVIAFDDVHLIFRGFSRAVLSLRDGGIAHRAYVLPDKVAVIELGGLDLVCTRGLADRVATPDALMYLTDDLGRYRDAIVTLKRLPGSRLAQRMISLFPFGRPFRPR